MDSIETVMSQYPELSFEFEPMPYGMGGLDQGDKVTINSNLSKEEQVQWIYEEIGHSKTSTGDISDYKLSSNMVQEYRARTWGMTHHVPLGRLKELATERVDDDYEIADELGVRVDYLHDVGTMYGFKFKSI
ncbi:ImmA/IrrE family metallo-endopeptidase [Lentilactobacillus sp. SPB1-3]|uniref:ImmA/IrrE family metallo-endopeptidase n=1 Tax=Lentilactobacillus terminaliae TaxID=3003483 RepID=A0ACD5DDC8_9LACO|nr:ImmA/IrrE family metallo-endopeptidase [Lentilactobacillus sp. SPB1-3]MCZ0978149.1 hypothetical protein [Lentilactobacillus sp. SPB1-3]